MTPSIDLANAPEWTSNGPLNPEISAHADICVSEAASEAAAWRAALHGLMGVLHLESTLIDHARAGFARHLRPDVVRQAEVTSFLEGLRSERSSQQVHLIDHLGMHYGDHALWSIPVSGSHWVTDLMGVVLSRMPALAVVILMCVEQAAQYLYEALAQVARQSGRLDLMHQLLHMRARSERHLMGLQSLTDTTPELSLPGRLLARASIALWNQRALRPLTRHLDAVSRLAGVPMTLEAVWTRDLFQQPLLNALASTAEPRPVYQTARAPRC